MSMKACTKEELELILQKRKIWMGQFQYGTGETPFAFNHMREECYLVNEFNQNIQNSMYARAVRL